jgi:hypothetical protein
MSNDTRDVLDVLQSELEFIEKGGYGRSVQTPWQPSLIFQDSLSCMNLADPLRQHPCSECLLIDFVPREQHAEGVPCHHIPLDVSGETVAALDRDGNEPRLEEALKGWLRATIKRLEQERGEQPARTPE